MSPAFSELGDESVSVESMAPIVAESKWLTREEEWFVTPKPPLRGSGRATTPRCVEP